MGRCSLPSPKTLERDQSSRGPGPVFESIWPRNVIRFNKSNLDALNVNTFLDTHKTALIHCNLKLIAPHPISLLRVSLLRFVDPNCPGNSMDMRTPPLKIKTLPESNPPKSRIVALLWRLALPVCLGLGSGVPIPSVNTGVRPIRLARIQKSGSSTRAGSYLFEGVRVSFWPVIYIYIYREREI